MHSRHDLYNNLLESALYQHVQKPTREHNILDLVLTTEESLVSDLMVGTEFSDSDHRIISFKIKLRENMKTSEEKVWIIGVRIFIN